MQGKSILFAKVKCVCYNTKKEWFDMEQDNISKTATTDAPKVQLKAQQKDDRYARVDTQGGYLYNSSEINYYKQTQAIDVMDNLMLGDFNKKGSYIINSGINTELLNMRKVYQYSFGSTTFCQSATDFGDYGKLDFAIKLKNNKANGKTSATLQVLETIDRANGYYQNTNSANVAVYTAKESNTYVVDMLKYFNVVSKKEDGLIARDKNEEEINLILARKNYENTLKRAVMPLVDERYKSLLGKRLKMLAKYDAGKDILTDYAKESYKINGWFVKEGMPGYYRHLNQVLDGLVDIHSADVLQNVALKASWNKENDRFVAECQKDIAMQQTNTLKTSMGAQMYDQSQKANTAQKSEVEGSVAQHKNVQNNIEEQVL